MGSINIIPNQTTIRDTIYEGNNKNIVCSRTGDVVTIRAWNVYPSAWATIILPEKYRPTTITDLALGWIWKSTGDISIPICGRVGTGGNMTCTYYDSSSGKLTNATDDQGTMFVCVTYIV